MVTVRQVRVSVLGRKVRKAFGKKRAKKLYHSIKVAVNTRTYNTLNAADIDIMRFIAWSNTPQGITFWYYLHREFHNAQINQETT